MVLTGVAAHRIPSLPDAAYAPSASSASALPVAAGAYCVRILFLSMDITLFTPRIKHLGFTEDADDDRDHFHLLGLPRA